KPDAFDAAPQWAVNLSAFARLFDKVFASPLLVRVDELFANMHKCPRDPFAEWADSDRLRNVSDLHVSNFQTSAPAGVSAFFDGPASASLTKLGIYTLG